jgi:hypothetical protein
MAEISKYGPKTWEISMKHNAPIPENLAKIELR